MIHLNYYLIYHHPTTDLTGFLLGIYCLPIKHLFLYLGSIDFWSQIKMFCLLNLKSFYLHKMISRVECCLKFNFNC